MNSNVKKLIVVFTVLAIIALFPASSVSKTNQSESVVLSSDNIMVLGSEINGESTAAIISKAKDLDANLSGLKERVSGKRPIYLFVNSPGGGVQSGLEMIEALQGLGRPIHTITLFSASMAFQVVQSLNDRLILKNGVMMSHHATGQQDGEFGGSVRTQMENRQQLWLDRVREMDEQTVKRTNGKQTYESYTREYDHEMWLTGTKSVDQGYADKVVKVKCDASLKGVTTQHTNFLGLDVSFDLDNCPLNTSPMNVRISSPDGKTLLNRTLEEEIKKKFLQNFENKQKQVVALY